MDSGCKFEGDNAPYDRGSIVRSCEHLAIARW